MSKDHTNHRVFNFDKFKLHGKELKREEALKFPVMAAGDGLPEENTVYVFDSHQDFLKWSKETKQADTIDQTSQKIEKIKQNEKGDNTAAKQRQEKLAKRVLEDLQELSERSGLPISSRELLMKASDDSNLLEGRIFHRSAILWEQSGGIGAAWPVFGVPYPDLNWFRWGNRAVSIHVNGVALLTDKSWFSGPSVWLFGLFWPLFELSGLGFEFRAEAALSYAPLGL